MPESQSYFYDSTTYFQRGVFTSVEHATGNENSTNPHQLPPSFLGEGWGGGYFRRRIIIV
jgi:hypothetical protein